MPSERKIFCNHVVPSNGWHGNGGCPLTTKAQGMEYLIVRVQAALGLATKAQAQSLVNIFVSSLEDTLV